MKLTFSSANAKTRKLCDVPELQPFLSNGRKVYSLDLLSGWSCPFAKECLSKVYSLGDSLKLHDGKDTKFRCFSASQEVIYSNVYKLRKRNFDNISHAIQCGIGRLDLAKIIEYHMPKNLGILRMHVAGDFFNQTYFDAIALLARRNQDRLVYAYTKSINFWVNRMGQLTDNFVLTASNGGKLDNAINEYKLRKSVVVFDEESAKNRGLDIDHDDSHAACPSKRNEDFALMLHGVQPKNSEASKALYKLRKNKVEHSYNRSK